ncbi:hypothetical protein SH139x_000230 [Planctomycetaceae bacterium SH139]
MDQQIIIWGVAVPGVVALFAWLLSMAVGRGLKSTMGLDASEKPATASAVQGSLYVVGFSVALGLALYGRQTWSIWPEDVWQRVLWPISLTGLAMAIVLGDRPSLERWRCLLGLLGAVATAYVVIPTGSGWEDTVELHRFWVLAVVLSACCNMWSLDWLARRGTVRWVLLVAIAGQGGAAMLAGSEFGSLAEWQLAAISVTSVAALIAMIGGQWAALALLYPAMLMAAATIASWRFYSYTDYPWWLYAVVLFLPSAIGLLDLLLLSKQSTWMRVSVAAVFAVMMLALVAWQAFGASGEAEW